jgi:hypothetical protein
LELTAENRDLTVTKWLTDFEAWRPARLREVGFALDNGEDDTGFFLKLLRLLSGYYLNVGASDLIADDRIKLKSGVTIDRLEGGQAVFSDGSRMDVDLLVLATGWKPLQEAVRAMLGDEVAERADRSGASVRTASCATCSVPHARKISTSSAHDHDVPVLLAHTALLIKGSLEGLSISWEVVASYRPPPLQPAQPLVTLRLALTVLIKNRGEKHAGANGRTRIAPAR